MSLFSSLFGGNKDTEAQKKKDFDILKYDGIRAQRIGKLAYAIQCFKEAIGIQEDLETMNHLATAYTQMNQMEEACAVAMRMTEIAPEDPGNFLTLANLHYMMENYQKMDEACKKALVINEQIPVAYYLSAKAAIGLNNAIQAIAMLTKALMLKEDFAEAYLLRAEVLWSMRQAKDAMEDINKLLQMDEEDESALLLKGEIMAITEDAGKAMEVINLVLTMNPFNEKAYLLKGNLLLAQKATDEAIAVYDEALELNPNFAQAYHERGRAKLDKGDKEGSMEDMKKAIELAPESSANISGQYNNYDHLTKNVPF